MKNILNGGVRCPTGPGKSEIQWVGVCSKATQVCADTLVQSSWHWFYQPPNYWRMEHDMYLSCTPILILQPVQFTRFSGLQRSALTVLCNCKHSYVGTGLNATQCKKNKETKADKVLFPF